MTAFELRFVAEYAARIAARDARLRSGHASACLNGPASDGCACEARWAAPSITHAGAAGESGEPNDDLDASLHAPVALLIVGALASVALAMSSDSSDAATAKRPDTAVPAAKAGRTWASGPNATLGPGVRTYTGARHCTANFVFIDRAKNVYLGHAAHCAELGESPADGCRAASRPLGTHVTFDSGRSASGDGEVVGTENARVQQLGHHCGGATRRTTRHECKPSAGLEPATPSLPSKIRRPRGSTGGRQSPKPRDPSGRLEASVGLDDGPQMDPNDLLREDRSGSRQPARLERARSRPRARGEAASSSAAGSGSCSPPGSAGGSPGARPRPPRRGRPG